MFPELEKLLRLQERDVRILAVRSALNAIPLERAARETELENLAKTLDSRRARSREIEVARKSLEGEALAHRERIARYKTQQMQTRKNDEYAALAHEIQSAEAAIVLIEDRELELMAEAEELEPVLLAADVQFQEGKTKVASQLEGVAAKQKNLLAEMETLEQTRPPLLEGIDPDLLDFYSRLMRSKNGSAIVALENGVCTGCHMSVPQQTVVETRSGQSVVHCPQCGRILFSNT